LNPLYENMATSVFERMSGLAAQHQAINLGQGFPDFGWPGEILDAAARAVKERSNQYAPSRGIPHLRDAVASHYNRHHGLSLDAAQVCVTSGATEALGAAILASVKRFPLYCRLQEKGEARYARVMEIAATRGRVLDRNGEALAVSTPVKSVWAIPGDVDAGDRERRKLASLLAMQKIELDKRLGDGSRDFVYQAPDRSRDRGGGAATRPQGHSRARRISALLSRR